MGQRSAFRAKEAMRKGNDKVNFSILERHDERRLRHTLWCPVFLRHPDHGELFFNSASCLIYAPVPPTPPAVLVGGCD